MRMSPRLRRRLLPFAYWLTPAVLLAYIGSERGQSFTEALIYDGLPFGFWALVTPGIIDTARKYPPETLKTLRGFLVHALTGILCGIGCGIVAGFAVMLVRPVEINDTALHFLLKGLAIWCFFGLVFYTLVVSVGFVIVTQERLRERERRAAALEAELKESQLSALRMQLHPHFLFNALNTVAMHVREGDRDTSVRIITRLSELLRHLLDGSAAQEIPLGREIEQITRYLDIERARFSDRLRVDVEMQPGIEEALVPNFVLQPIVENAIRHGIAARAASGILNIRASRVADDLVLRVENDGAPLPDKFTFGHANGVGLRNTLLRLHHLYGDRWAFDLRNERGMVRAHLTMPYHTAPLSEHE